MLLNNVLRTSISARKCVHFTIKGFYGQTIPYCELIQIDTVSIVPKVELRTNGYAFGKTKTGNFRLAGKIMITVY